MHILFSQLPKSHWWEKGTPVHKDNWSMKIGRIPNQKIVEKEYKKCLSLLKKHTTIHVYPFPQELDLDGLYRHDAVFTRDSFISNQKGDIVISNFSEFQRKEEALAMQRYLKKQKFRLHFLSDTAYAEGGEFYFIFQDNIAFAGVCRNNKKGIEETAKKLGIKNIVIVETASMHLDTVFSALIGKNGKLVGALACLRLIKNREALKKHFQAMHLPLIGLHIKDSVNKQGQGTIAVNCLPLPGKLFGGGLLTTPGVEEKIKKLGINHIVSPVTQFKVSGGGIHCLTNELFAN